MAWNNWKKKLYVPGQKEVFALSRSKVELFMQCPKCFYLDRVHGIARPSFPAFLLNSAVDTLFKKEFDLYRTKSAPHPLMTQYKIDAVPYQHPDIETWRHTFTGIRVHHKKTNFEVFGAVDDIWIDSQSALHVVDYKSTSKDGEIDLHDRWKEGYKRQLEFYQWLLMQQGLNVSDIGYFVYANGRTDKNSFDSKLEFDVTILEYTGTIEWVEHTLISIKKTLEATQVPEASRECEYCTYVHRRRQYDEDDQLTIIM